MNIQQCADPGEFLAVVEPLLVAEPVLYNQFLSIVYAVRSKPTAYGNETPYFLAVTDKSGEVVGAALRTPPWPLGITALDSDGARALADYLHGHAFDVPVVYGPKESSALFADAWTTQTGVVAEPRLALRLYALSTVVHAPASSGVLRACTIDDLDQVHRWLCEFVEDANLPEGPPTRERVADRLADGFHYVWEVDGQPTCSLSKAAEPVEGVARVNSVYTPREMRGRGYGTDATAALSQLLLDTGATACVLYADLSNPTSNKIYQNVGYRHRCDFQQFKFTQPT